MKGGLLISGGTVITLDEKNRIIPEGAVYLENGRIREVGRSASMSRRRRGAARRVEARGKLILPGFICAHHHLYSTFARGMALKNFAPRNFLEILKGLWWKLDRSLTAEDIFHSARSALIECIRRGTTTVIDHHESQTFQSGALDELWRAASETGLRAAFCLGSSDRYGRKKAREGVAENERFLTEMRRLRPERVAAMVGLHAAFTVSQETLEASCDAARRFSVGVHVHCAEDEMDEKISLSKFKKRVIHRLARAGALGPKSLAVHCVHISQGEADILSDTKTAVVHNPESNMNNAVGAARVLDFLKRGILVGLGTDGMSSDMPAQMRCAYLLQRHLYRDPRVAFSEAPRLLLENNRTIAKRLFGWEVGVLKEGALGDVIVVDYDPPTPLSSQNFLGHLLFGIAGAPVDSTIIHGKVLMKHKRLVNLDEERVMTETREQAKKLWRRLN